MDLRRLLAVTTLSTAVTALAGVYTAVSGAGLTCEARWPLCDGPLGGLLPANLMSFVEWSHRLVAMVTGLLIVGSAYAAWRGGHPRRIRLAVLLAVLVVPVQVVLGALTVTTYELAVLTAHFGTAAVILGSLVAATVWADAERRPVEPSRVRRAAAGATVGFPVLVALTPRLLVTFGGLQQFVYYGVGFATFAVLCVVALWGRELDAEAVSIGAGAAAVLVVAVLVVSRHAFGRAGQYAVVGLSLAAFAFALATLRRAGRLEVSPSRAGPAGD